jgi:hypothetical protein
LPPSVTEILEPDEGGLVDLRPTTAEMILRGDGRVKAGTFGYGGRMVRNGSRFSEKAELGKTMSD